MAYLAYNFLVWILIVFKDLIKISKNKEFSNNTKDIKEIKTELKSFINSSASHIQKLDLLNLTHLRKLVEITVFLWFF